MNIAFDLLAIVTITDFNWYAWIILPVMIFFARIIDVSLGTVRIILVSKGYRLSAPLIGFLEVFIWITVISQLFSDAHHPIYYIAYAGGFAAGNYVGMFIADKMYLGDVMVRVITKIPATSLIECLRSLGYNITSIPAQGSTGEVHLIFTVIPRKQLKTILAKIKEYNPNAFYTVEEVRFVSEGEFSKSHRINTPPIQPHVKRK